MAIAGLAEAASIKVEARGEDCRCAGRTIDAVWESKI